MKRCSAAPNREVSACRQTAFLIALDEQIRANEFYSHSDRSEAVGLGPHPALDHPSSHVLWPGCIAPFRPLLSGQNALGGGGGGRSEAKKKLVYLKLTSNFRPFDRLHFLPEENVGRGWPGPQTKQWPGPIPQVLIRVANQYVRHFVAVNRESTEQLLIAVRQTRVALDAVSRALNDDDKWPYPHAEADAAMARFALATARASEAELAIARYTAPDAGDGEALDLMQWTAEEVEYVCGHCKHFVEVVRQRAAGPVLEMLKQSRFLAYFGYVQWQDVSGVVMYVCSPCDFPRVVPKGVCQASA